MHSISNFSVKVLCEAGCNLSYLTTSDWQQPPLIWAIGHQNLEMVKLMVKHNVNLNEVYGYTRRTPLGCAVGDKKLGKLNFIKKGVISLNPSSIYSWFLKLLSVLHSRFPTKKS